MSYLFRSVLSQSDAAVAHRGHPVDLGAFRQRALLALLLTAPNSVFSTDQILDELWGDAGGVDKQNALWVYVSGLRKALTMTPEQVAVLEEVFTRALEDMGATSCERAQAQLQASVEG